MFSSGTNLNINPNLSILSQLTTNNAEGASQATKRKTSQYILQTKYRKKPKNQSSYLQNSEIRAPNVTSTTESSPLLPSNIVAPTPSKSILEKIDDIIQELLPFWIDRERECCFKLLKKVKLLHYSYWNNRNGIKASQFNNLDRIKLSAAATTNAQTVNENSNLLLQNIFSSQIIDIPPNPIEVHNREMRIEELSKELWHLLDEPSLKLTADFLYENLHDALECRYYLLFEKLCEKGRNFFAIRNDISIYLQNEIFFSQLIKEDLPIILIGLKYAEDLSYLSSNTCAILYFHAIKAKIYALKTGEFEETLADNVIDVLLQKKVMLNSADKNKMTPLMYAAKSNLATFKKFIHAGAKLDVFDNHGKGIIFYALEAKQFAIVEYIKELMTLEKIDGRELISFNSDNEASFTLLKNFVCRDCYEGVDLFLSFGSFNKEKLINIFINNVVHYIGKPKAKICRLILNHFNFRDSKEENDFIHFVIQSLLDKFIGKSFSINPRNLVSVNFTNNSSESSINVIHSPAAAPLTPIPTTLLIASPVLAMPIPKTPVPIPFTALEKISQMNSNVLKLNSDSKKSEIASLEPSGVNKSPIHSNRILDLAKKKLDSNFSAHFSSTAIVFIEQGLSTLISANVNLNIPDSQGDSIFIKSFYHLIINRVDKEIISKFVLWMLEKEIKPTLNDFQLHNGFDLKIRSHETNEIIGMKDFKANVLKDHVLFHFLDLDNPQIFNRMLSFTTDLTMKNSKGHSLLEVAIRRVYDFVKGEGDGNCLNSENELKAGEESIKIGRSKLMELIFKRREIVKLLLPRLSVYEVSTTMMSFMSHPYEDDIKKLLEL